MDHFFLDASKRTVILVQELAAVHSHRQRNVIIRIACHFAGNARTYFDILNRLIAAIDQVMTIALASGEPRTLTSTQYLFTNIGNEYCFTTNHINKFIFACMPVTQG